MRVIITAVLLSAMAILAASPASALQCVAFAREQSGIGLRGDAWTWWTGAVGQYDRGQAPRPGAVVVFKKHGSMRHGHVAVVADVVTARRVLVDHANWAPNRGHGRGRVATLVTVTDVSPHNDWSQVRVWNDASGELGTRIYPTYGFIYPRASAAGTTLSDPEGGVVAALPDLASEQPTSLGGEPAASAVGAVASVTDLLTAPIDAGGLAMAAGLAD